MTTKRGPKVGYDYEAIITAYAGGERVKAIAARFGCPVSYPGMIARQHAANLGMLVRLRKKGNRPRVAPTARDRQVLDLALDRTKTYSQIGAIMGISKQRVHQVLTRWKWKRTAASGQG